ncbi:type 1 glutamine amidotransferase [Lacticaseibacillus pabuli]|uniref:Type 1 glutamine amidotransferase n=1 Tax=Lacticaseibacillus pabuli TaxID=3025672 RepID=A0ABY7WSF7_9LACO|nr:type 1 glutamine amidotransferase [Lacticaseibacillus sp. KACC 23028]WDF83115.1 type 1 glutamine amidotransferase [Lacticaseibacillus sp. KACC 23028]
MKIDVMQHSPIEGLAMIQTWGEENDVEFVIHRLDEGEDIRALNPAEMNGLIVLGGPMSVNDDFDWLAAERIYIRSLAKLGRPVLGICLGAQQIVRAFGAPVFESAEGEYGFAPVTDLRDDSTFTAFHWHGEEMAELPGATQLYTNATTSNQGFVYHDNIVGLQFHLEADEEEVTALQADEGRVVKPGAPEIQAEMYERLASTLDDLFTD